VTCLPLREEVEQDFFRNGSSFATWNYRRCVEVEPYFS
jgi:hypothetical protein